MRLLASIALAVVLLVLLPATQAEEKRVHFAYRNDDGSGYIKQTGQDTWVEVLPNGGTNSFKETAREKDYIEIYDSTRGEVWVRIYATRLSWKHPELTLSEWRPLWAGSWDARTHFAYRNDDGSGSIKQTGQGTWVEALPNGGTNSFKETAREEDYIEIYDSTRGEVWVRIYATRLSWKHPELTLSEWRPLWAGSWEANTAPEGIKARCLEEYGQGRDSIEVDIGGTQHKLKFDVNNYPPFYDKAGREIKNTQNINAVIRFDKHFFFKYTKDGRHIGEVRLAD